MIIIASCNCSVHIRQVLLKPGIIYLHLITDVPQYENVGRYRQL